MTISCCRCAAPSTVLMTYVYAERLIWLGDLDGPIDSGAGYAMCEKHANRLSPPVGWMLNDRRQPIRQLFPTREVA